MSSADIVNEWYRERLAGGAIARDTDAYNQLVAALPALIARLDAAAAPQPAVSDLASEARAAAALSESLNAEVAASAATPA